MKSSEPPIITEITVSHPPEEVWKVITEPELMRSWFFDNIPSFEPKLGFETQFPVSSEERTFTHCWKVVEVIPNQKIAYEWNYTEYPGDSIVSFELSAADPGTRLRLTHRVIQDFPDEIPEFRGESCQGGWDYFIGERLQTYLDKS